MLLLSFAVALSAPGFGCDRQIRCPARVARHQLGKFFRTAEVDRHFARDLVMRVHHDLITGGFDPLHGFDKNVSGNCR